MENEVKALKAQIAEDKRHLQQMEEQERELLSNISCKGFQTATERVLLVEKIRALRDSVRKAQQRLAATEPRSH